MIGDCKADSKKNFPRRTRNSWGRGAPLDSGLVPGLPGRAGGNRPSVAPRVSAGGNRPYQMPEFAGAGCRSRFGRFADPLRVAGVCTQTPESAGGADSRGFRGRGPSPSHPAKRFPTPEIESDAPSRRTSTVTCRSRGSTFQDSRSPKTGDCSRWVSLSRRGTSAPRSVLSENGLQANWATADQFSGRRRAAASSQPDGLQEALGDLNFRTLFQFHVTLSTVDEAVNGRSDPLLFELHVEPEAADLVGQYVEAGGGAGFQGVLPLDHRLVDLGPPLDVVALDGQ